MKKAIKFVFISGCGFIIDFIIYSILTILLKINVDVANMISSLLGTTFVFFTSTKRIFETNVTRLSLKTKYIIYIIYQCLFIFAMSKILLLFARIIMSTNVELIVRYSSLLSKVCITPITLVINYFVMKKLTSL